MKKLTHAATTTLLAASLAIVALAAGAPSALATDAGVERTPVLGWSSWSFLREKPTAANMEQQALALHTSGLQKMGYQYVNLDDFWYHCPGSQGPDVGPYGRWVTDASKFPARGDTNGIQVLAAHVHGLGQKFGIYITPGISRQAVQKKTPIKGTKYTADQIANPSVEETNYNCHGMVAIDFNKPGAQAYINSWADMFAQWGVDYIKLDGMGNRNVGDIKAWSKAIKQSGRPMILNITQGSFTTAIAPVLMKYANQWEFAPDIECYDCEKGGSSYPLTDWANIKGRFDFVARWQPYAGPGGFNDYDSIEVGNGANNGLTPDERRTQMSLWALGASPFILGVDLAHLDPHDLHDYLENAAVLAVDQDGIAAKRIVHSGNHQVFAKLAANGDGVVGLFNTGATTERVSVAASAAGLAASKQGYALEDLWTGKKSNTTGTIEASVPSHGVVLYRVKPRSD
ncbi:MAG: glycoside hydrolase family 27 protein [Rhodanobacter sp.]